MRRTVWVIVLLLAGGFARAQTNNPALLYQVARGKVSLEEWHDRWSETIAGKVEYFDRFFGDERIKDDTTTTRLSLRLGVKADRKNDLQMQQSVDARLALPRLQNRLQVILDNTVDVDESPSFERYREALREHRPDAGLRYILRENESFRLSGDAGVRLGGSPQVFGRARARYTVPFDLWELRLSERGQWYSQDGFGALSDMTWSRTVGDHDLLRLRTTLNWEEEQRGVEPGQSIGYFHAINEHTSFNSLLRATWPETPHGGKAVYGLETTLRRLVYSNWIFVEVNPGIEYLDEDSFGWNPFLKVGFEFQFQRDPAAK